MKTETYTGGRQMMATDVPDFTRPITIADITPGTLEYEAHEAYRNAIKDQHLWELDRAEREKNREDFLRTVSAMLSGVIMIALMVVAIIAFGQYIGA